MELNSARHIAFDYLDKLLKGIDNKRIVTINDMGDPLGPEVSHLINQINDKYALFGYIMHDQKFTLILNWEGTKVLDAGGIREYLLDNDTSIQFYQGFPKVFTITDTDKEIVIGKWMINTQEEYADLCDWYAEPPYQWTTRITRRSGINDPVKTNSSPAPASTHLHVEGHGNTINAGSGNIHQNTVKGNQGKIKAPYLTGRLAELGELPSTGWKWTERYSWIAAIVGTILTALGILYEVYWKK